MPSSTSNSEPTSLQIPRRALFTAGLAAGGVALVTLGAFEVRVRASGFVPELRDSPDLWCDERLRANSLGARCLALVGTSRFQLGLDPRALAPFFPKHVPINLAITGGAALPVFGDLAADKEFCGTVLCEVMPQSFFDRRLMKASAVPWLAYAQSRPAASRIEGALRRMVQRHVAGIQPPLDLRSMLRRALTNQGGPERPYFQLRDDRFTETDYTKTDLNRLLARRIARTRGDAPAPEGRELAAILETIAEWCRAIEGRGGRVVFVRMISSLRVREIEDRDFPRAKYWEPLLRVTRVAGVYDQDLPEVAKLTCPDGSHLDSQQARIFTQALGAALKARQLT